MISHFASDIPKMSAPEKKDANLIGSYDNDDHDHNNNKSEINQRPNKDLSSGQESDLEIINQYGQLMGEFSRLDDDLWLTSPRNHDALITDSSDQPVCDTRENMVALELLAKCAENSDSLGSIISVTNDSSSFSEFSQDKFLSSSPVSVLQKRSCNKVMPMATKSSRRNHHFAKGDARTSCAGEACQLFLSENPVEPFLLDDLTDSSPPKLVRTRKISDLLQLHSERNQNPTPETALKQKLEVEAVKQCIHCHSTNTPQWRNGPMGRKTLCNACGIAFKKFGGLFPGYRPLQSSAFNHSEETALKQNLEVEAVKQCIHCHSTNTLQWRNGPLGRKTLCNACGIAFKKFGGLFPGYRPLQSSPFNHPDLPNITEKSTSSTIKVKNVLQREVVDNSEVVQNCTPQSGSVQELTEEKSDLLDPDFRLGKRKPIAKSSNKKKLPKGYVEKCLRCEAVKQCIHCHSINTPQWRDGPMGRKTLCNACGIAFKKFGGLFPGHRPLQSSPFNHSDLPNVTETSTSSTIKVKNVQQRKVVDSSEVVQNCASQSKSVQEMTEEKSDLLDPDFRLGKQEPIFKLTPKKKLPKVSVKKCLHCESVETPQWREGPSGRNTLCNACGVQFKHGRLFPEYRPLKSPTYDPSLHSHLPKKVQQMRMKQISETSAISSHSEQLA